jgi:hypothetical protein
MMAPRHALIIFAAAFCAAAMIATVTTIKRIETSSVAHPMIHGARAIWAG